MPQGLSLARFDAVLFDVDGTLADSLGMIVPRLADAIERYADIRPQLQHFLSYSPIDDQLRERIDFTLARFDAYVDREKFFELAVATPQLFKRMGLETALVTSKSACELTQFVRRIPGADSVDVTVCSTDVRNPKPAPDTALMAVSKPGAASPLLIGDSINDMRCAHAAGIATVAVGNGAASQDALLAEHPDMYIDTPEALLAWAQSSFLNRNAPQENTNRRLVDHDRRGGIAKPYEVRAAARSQQQGESGRHPAAQAGIG